MLNAKQILVSAFVLAAVVASLTGCGQTGSLYLPTRPATPASAPAAS
jgi:predicted small lipoprotein YifL